MTAPSVASLSVVAATTTSITVGWTTPADNGTALASYDLFRLGPGGTYVFVPLGTNTLAFTGLAPGTAYTFQHQSRNVLNQTSPPAYLTASTDAGEGGSPSGSSGGPGLCFSDRDGRLTINSFDFCNAAFWAYDLWELIFGPDLKGANGPKPGAPGVFANPMRATETTYDLPLAIAGECDSTGALYSVDSVRGFERNIWALRAAVLDPVDTVATVTARLVTADGQILTGECQPLKLIRGQMVEGDDALTGGRGLAMKATLRVRFPGGAPLPVSG